MDVPAFDHKQMPQISEWYRVTFDSDVVTRDVRPPEGKPWTDSFPWKDVIRVCYEPSPDMYSSDTIYIFTQGRDASYAIPTEALGGSELWGAVLERGLFDPEISLRISMGQLGFSCWPPITDEDLSRPGESPPVDDDDLSDWP